MLRRRQLLLTSTLALLPRDASANDGWAALRTGAAFVLLRHATAPGTGTRLPSVSGTAAPRETSRPTDALRRSGSAQCSGRTA
jgi:hypothetical protein